MSEALDRAADADLLRAHVDGDPDAFGVLFRRHRDRLWAVALRTMGNPEDAADGLQDGMIAAYRRAGSFRGDSAVTTWLHRVVVNACLDRVRRSRSRPTVPLPEGPLEPADPHDRLGERETSLAVHEALAGLAPEQRAAILLVDVHGLPVDEVARVLGVAPGTVKSRCSRGRARLAVALGHLREPGRNPAGPAPVPPLAADPRPAVPPTGPSAGGGT